MAPRDTSQSSDPLPKKLPSVEEMIEEFYALLPWPTRDHPTADIPDDEVEVLKYLIHEENAEFLTATERRDIQLLADALADIVYVAYSAARHFGFDLHRVIWAVHEANMSKKAPSDKFELDKKGKVIRGPNYQAPDIWGALYGRKE